MVLFLSQIKMALALAEIKQLGCRFIVAGRSTAYFPSSSSGESWLEPSFLTLGGVLDKCTLPQELLSDLFIEIPREDFEVDLSSSAIRAALEDRSSNQS